MKLLGLNITLARNHPASGTKSTNQKSFTDPLWADGGPAHDPGPLMRNAYEQVVWVYRAINILAEQVANIPFLFSRGERGRENLITSGPLCDFYDQPHPHINRFQYWELRILWLMLRGESIRIPIYDDAVSSSSSSSFSSSSSNSRSPDSIRNTPLKNHPGQSGTKLKNVLILDPSHFHHIIDNHELIGWRYTGAGPNAPLESQVFLPEEVWFERLPNPFDFWRGLPPLQLASLPAKTDFAAANFMRSLLENNCETGLIIRTSEELDDAQREQILAAIRNRKARAGSPDRPLLLWSAAEIVKPELSSADLQFLENRRFSRAEICAAFGVPEELITATEHAKYDVMQEARLNFIENRVAPLCARLEASERVTVRALDPSAVGWFDLDSLPIMEQARRNRLAAAKTGFDMGIPFSELNRIFDLGFHQLPHGNTCYLPNSLNPVGTLVPNRDLNRNLNPATPNGSSRDLPRRSSTEAGHEAPINGSQGQSSVVNRSQA